MFDLTGQGLLQLGELALAFLLSSIVGIEREMRQKSAGLRTYTLVGVAPALFTLISEYGFNDILRPQVVVLDPSRIAAQVVSGIGFIGGGVIFMRRDAVRGLTTAASVWLTAALGMACGAGLMVLAIATTLAHLNIMFVFPLLVRHLPTEGRVEQDIEITYDDGKGILRTLLVLCTEARFRIQQVRLPPGVESGEEMSASATQRPPIRLQLRVSGKRPISHLITRLSQVRGVCEVGAVRDDRDVE